MKFVIYDRFSHLNDTEAGAEALEAYEVALESGKSAEEAEIITSNTLQRFGYNVNAFGGASIRRDFSESPGPNEIKATRAKSGLSQTAAADLIHSTLRTWQDWEAGVAKMHPGLWELFNIKLA